MASVAVPVVITSFLAVAVYGVTSPKPGDSVPEEIVQAVIEVESSGNPNALRYEAHLPARFRCSANDLECRAISTSVGLMQVVPGFHLKRCGLRHWKELLDPEENVRCGRIVLEDCYRRSGKDWSVALKCYNGSSNYPPKVIAAMRRTIKNEN